MIESDSRSSAVRSASSVVRQVECGVECVRCSLIDRAVEVPNRTSVSLSGLSALDKIIGFSGAVRESVVFSDGPPAFMAITRNRRRRQQGQPAGQCTTMH